LLEEVTNARLDLWNAAQAEALQGVQSGVTSGSRGTRADVARESTRRARKLEAEWFVSDRTTAMVRAMSELFAMLAQQYPEVKEFREKVLGGRFLTADEAHALIASYAARTFSREWFEEWGIPFVGHRAEVVNTGPRGEDYNPVDDWMTIWVTVRYAYPCEEEANTRCTLQGGAVIPIHTPLPVQSHGDYVYPSWLWPGSVVDELYELSVELASTFDWPLASSGHLAGTRPRSEAAAWFVLTGETPEVRPIEARWETKQGRYLSPQWRIRLTLPPWLPEEEVLRAYRLLRGERPKGLKLPKTTTPLEVAGFVWEQERIHGYRKVPSWRTLYERWNEAHPGYRFKSYNNFRMYFMRGGKAVRELNFGWPQPDEEGYSDE
jgi:hypothetical protein